jgi:hypothetical protein
MTTRDSRDPIAAEETFFRPRDGGYLFEMPSLWLFWPGRRYMVTDAQKTALLEALRPMLGDGLAIAIAPLIIIASACGIGAAWWATGGGDRCALVLPLVGAAVLLPFYAFAAIAMRRRLRGLAPILAAAAPTRARFTAGERLQAAAAAMPLRALINAALVWGLLVIATVVIAAAKHNPLLGEPRFFRELVQLGLAMALLLAVSRLRRHVLR